MLELLRSLFVICWLTILPGFLLCRFIRLPSLRELPAAVAIYFAIGLSFWPLLLLWLSVAGFQLTGQGARYVTILWCGLGFVLLFVEIRQRWPKRRLSHSQIIRIIPSALLFLFVAWTRYAHAQSLVLPNWVDSVHHAMIVRIIIEQGSIGETLSPFMPTGQFLYHWGYHALMAWTAWLQGRTDAFQVVELMLSGGQALSMMSVLMLYVAGRWFFNSRRAGLFVALVGGLVIWFPAYYISWGRYTHLTGVLLMAPLCYSLWRSHTDPCNGWNWSVASILLAAGLLLIHVRVAVFMAILAGLMGIVLIWQRQWLSLLRWVVSGVGALLLTLPWFWRLLNSSQASHLSVLGQEAQAEWWSAINSVSWSLLWVPGVHEAALIASGGISGLFEWIGSKPHFTIPALLWLTLTSAAVGIYGWNRLRAKQNRPPTNVDKSSPQPLELDTRSAVRLLPPFPFCPLLLIVAWTVATVLFLNLDRLGLPSIGFLNNNAAVITFFAPLSLFAGGIAAWVTGVLIPKRWLSIAMIGITLVAGSWGAYQMRRIVNPVTTLVHQADLTALAWIRESTPPDALFAVSVKPWLGDTYAGTDAGYWIPVLSDRNTILPPALYTSVMPYDEVLQMNQFFDAWSQINDLDNPDVRRQLKTMGVTHIYLGSRGGHLVLPTFFDKPYVRPVFAEGGVHIYELLE